MSEKTVANVIASALKRHGVDTIFAQSLPSAVVLACEAIGIRQLSYRQENMGGAMADGYARVTGKTSIVCAQNGPAATLLVAPLAEALKASVPVVALVQDVERHQFDKNAFQDFDQMALFAPCSKWVRRVISASRIEDYIDQAFIQAGSGRPGPAVLLLPADLLREAAQPSDRERTENYGHWPLDRTQPDAATLKKAASAIANAENPVVLAGGGAASREAATALSNLQEKAHLPVFTTNMGKGAVSETHDLSCGVLGALNGPRSLGNRTREIMDNADLVVLVGSRTNQNGTDSWRSVPKGAKVIHIDVDPTEIGKNYESMRLVGDAAATLNALAEAFDATDLARRRDARPNLTSKIAKAWAEFEKDRTPLTSGTNGPIRPEQVMKELQTQITSDAIVVADASYSSMWILGQLRTGTAGQRFITPRGLAGLGWGLPLAIGAKVGRPEAPVVVLVGDGGFGHSWAEMETMVRSDVPVVIIVLNNGVLGYQKDAETVKFGEYTSACYFAPVDHTELAHACDISAVRVSAHAEIAPAITSALASGKPHLIEIMSDPDAHPAISLYDGSLDKREEIKDALV